MLNTLRNKVKGVISLPFVRNTLKLSSSSVILMFLPLLVTPILSRLYTPSDYGDWGIYSSVYYIITAFIFLSYENTIVKLNSTKDIPNIIALCLFVSGLVIVGVGIFFYLGVIFNNGFCKSFPNVPILLIWLIVYVAQTIVLNLANREKLYGKMAISSVVNGLSQAVFRIAFGLWPIISYGLVIGNLLAQVLSTVILVVFLLSSAGSLSFNSISLNGIKKQAVENKKFPFFDAPARLIEFAIANLALIIMSFYWSKEDIGSYSMIVQFILLPITVIGSAMANVYYREISEQIDNTNQVSLVTRRAAKISFLVSVLPLLFLALGGDKLLVLFLGKQWVMASKLSLCLVIFSVPVILSEPLLPIYRALNCQEVRFKLNALCLILTMGGLILSAILTKDIYISVIVYSTLYAFVRFLMYFSILRVARIRIKEVSPYFCLVIIACYAILAIRLVNVLVE